MQKPENISIRLVERNSKQKRKEKLKSSLQKSRKKQLDEDSSIKNRVKLINELDQHQESLVNGQAEILEVNYQILKHLNKKETEDEESEEEFETDASLNQEIRSIFRSGDDSKVINFCLSHDLLKPPKCQNCKSGTKLQRDKAYCSGYFWRCVNCQGKTRLYSGNLIFQQFTIPLHKLLLLFFILIPKQIYSQEIVEYCGVGVNITTKARSIYLSILKEYFSKLHLPNMKKLGSGRKPVEVDESCFRRKFNRGRLYQCQQWVFRLVERDGSFARALFFAVPDKKAETLLPIIQAFVSKNTQLLVSDQWRAYAGLKSLGFTHETVNHSKNFVQHRKNVRKPKKRVTQTQRRRLYDKVNSHTVHTQNIENRWKAIQQRMKLKGGKRPDLMSSVYEAQFFLSSKKDLAESLIQEYQKVMSIQN